MKLIKKFVKERSGNFAITMALIVIPLVLAVGFAVDYSRYSNMRSHLQELNDAGALALAASGVTDTAELRSLAEKTIEANHNLNRAATLEIITMDSDDRQVALKLRSTIPTTFMMLGGVSTLTAETTAAALRPVPPGAVEVALVLDNTFSMATADTSGVTKMAALKTSANMLVDELMNGENNQVKIGLVPYAEYVNVGLQNRNAPWLEGADDNDQTATYSSPGYDRVSCYKSSTSPDPDCNINCTDYPERTYDTCVEYKYKPCTTYTDGVPTQTSCYDGCARTAPTTSAAYSVCTKMLATPVPPSSYTVTYHYKWRGCVFSRTDHSSTVESPNTYRLNDNVPSVRYGRIVEYEGLDNCLSPLTELTNDKQTVKDGISAMIYQKGSYKPNTYIPSGLAWGLNLLNPEEPLLGAGPYDPENKAPHKILVLMTDGENTMKFQPTTGAHTYVGYPASFDYTNPTDVDSRRVDMQQTNSDTLALCNYMKNDKKIEIYTIALMVNVPWAKQTLEQCATDSSHYFDATNAASLRDAFSAISRSIASVRLTQ